jgi:hypothetical protein
MERSIKADAVEFNGLIQHSFALRLHELHRPFYGANVEEMVSSRFKPTGVGSTDFSIDKIGELSRQAHPLSSWVPHSLLAEKGMTTLKPHGVDFLDQEDPMPEGLPRPFLWAWKDPEDLLWERFVFVSEENRKELSRNDFRVAGIAPVPSEDQTQLASKILAELIAHRRSMLFGLALANRFVNVSLPHAILAPTSDLVLDDSGHEVQSGYWMLQPLVSLIRVGHDGGDFRRMFSLTLFMIPIEDGACEQRKMSSWEIRRAVRAGWGLAEGPRPEDRPRFDVRGPLPTYISQLVPSVRQELDLSEAPAGEGGEAGTRSNWARLTLRNTAEAITFAVALRMAQGPGDCARRRVRQEIVDTVVSSLGNSRVSSVLVVDKRLNKCSAWRSAGGQFPGSLKDLMRNLSWENRIGEQPEHRLDRDFFDPKSYAIGVLPSSRCIVFATAEDQQRGRSESGLMQAGWLAYMVIGAATAIGTMRAIDRDLEKVDRSEPTEVAQIERDVVVDLHEIYDLDITWEAYRHRYRLLRSGLGINADYEALLGKLKALYRETDARYEAKIQHRLVVLTAAIVILSAFILVGTILLAVK